MFVQRLLDHFDTYELLHIDVNDVRDQLVEMGVQDEIGFHFVKMDHGRIRGILYRYTKHGAPYSAPIFCSEVIIANDMGDEDEAWKRLVAVKELLHIADCVNLTAQSEEAVRILFQKFALPPELRYQQHSGLPNSKSFMNDQIRIYLALAILIPEGCRAPLRALYAADKLSAREIAEIALVPVRYIDVVMDPAFEISINAFLAWERQEQDPPVRAVKAAGAKAKGE